MDDVKNIRQANFDYLMRSYTEERGEDIKRWLVIEDALRNPMVIDTGSWGNTTFEDERVRHRGLLL